MIKDVALTRDDQYHFSYSLAYHWEDTLCGDACMQSRCWKYTSCVDALSAAWICSAAPADRHVHVGIISASIMATEAHLGRIRYDLEIKPQTDSQLIHEQSPPVLLNN